MAKKEKKPKNILERTYNIPLRKEWLKVPRYKRAKKAVKAVKEFLMKHMKSEEVKVGKNLNLKVWERGIKNPPHHIKVNAVKSDDDIVRAELFGFDIKEKDKKKEEAVKKELGLEEKAKEKETSKSEEEKTSAENKEQEQQKQEKEPADKSAEKAKKKSAENSKDPENIK